jgi:hypothetical protein
MTQDGLRCLDIGPTFFESVSFKSISMFVKVKAATFASAVLIRVTRHKGVRNSRAYGITEINLSP